MASAPSGPSTMPPSPFLSAPSASDPLPKLRTAYGHFLLPAESPAHPSPSVLLRGVNLSSTSKFPPFPASDTPKSTSTRSERDQARLEELGYRTDIPYSQGAWDEAEKGGREGWFVGRPLKEEAADLHFRRLRAWGFTTIRWIIPWEALEHAGPGKYDEAYIDYTIRIMRKAKTHGLRVYISSHQDVFSRFTGGSGAPYWAVLACGINPRRVHQTGSAIMQNQWKTEGSGGEEGRATAEKGEVGDYPDMIWNSNTGRLAVRHCFTMFWASEVFAPKCTIDSEPVGPWLRKHFVGAYAHLAKRIKEAGDLLDDCLIGWDSINEPHQGFLEIPDLNSIPDSQEFRKGPSPTPLQALQLGVGHAVSGVENADFGSLGLKKKGTVTVTPPGGEGVWLTAGERETVAKQWGWTWGTEADFWNGGQQGCVWAGHGVWDVKSGALLKKDYFLKKANGEELDFIADFWKPAYADFITAIRQYHPDAISLINPPIFASPPDLDQQTLGERAALSSHYYDGLTMMGKRRHLFNADAVGIQRGLRSMFRAIKLGDSSIREGFRTQLAELANDAKKTDGIAGDSEAHVYPTIIGEMGTPWDLKESPGLLGMARGKLHRSDYAEPSKAMDQLLDACDGSNALSYTLWAYEPLNTHEYGDGWHAEDLSLFSYADLEGDDDLLAESPPDLRSLIMLGSRGIDSWCRPYPIESSAEVKEFSFNMSSKKFDIRLQAKGTAEDPLVATPNTSAEQGVMGYTKLFLPYVHYLADYRNPDEGTSSISGKRAVGSPDAEGSEWIKGHGPARIDLDVSEISDGELTISGQWGFWRYPLHATGTRELRLVVKPWQTS